MKVKDKKYHVNPTTGLAAICTATTRPCKYGGESGNENHYSSKKEAQEAYEKSMSSSLFTDAKIIKLNKDIRNTPAFNDVPTEILDKMTKYLSAQPFEAVAITPSGSMLYNSQLPNKGVHDYDFIILATPYDNQNRGATQYMNGELDLMIVNIHDIPNIAPRSTSITEAVYALQEDPDYYYMNDNNPYSNYLKSLRIPSIQYYDLLNDAVNNHSMRYTEPIDPNNANDLRNFKHVIRWTIYMKRWSDFGNSDKNINPKLSDAERELYLRTLASGTIKTIFE